jgi:hypothetical protein
MGTDSAAALAIAASFFTKPCELLHLWLSQVQKKRLKEPKPVNTVDHFDTSESLRHRHDLMVELYRVEQARELAGQRASAVEIERLERQQRMISDALARLAA